MKIRMIEGFYGLDQMGSDSDYYLAPVSYPMKETMEDPDSPDGATLELDITCDAELQAWADVKFTEHNVWEMEVPGGAVVKEDLSYPDAANEASAGL